MRLRLLFSINNPRFVTKKLACYIVQGSNGLEAMRVKSVSSAVLVGAFILSAWSNLIAAAFCPRYLSNRECSKPVASQKKKTASQPSCHHATDMETEDSFDSTSESSSQTPDAGLASESFRHQITLNLPNEECVHCWSHSQPTSGPAYITAIDFSQRLVDAYSIPAALILSAAPAPLISITPSEHGPPGKMLPRYVLLNVFRI